MSFNFDGEEFGRKDSKKGKKDGKNNKNNDFDFDKEYNSIPTPPKSSLWSSSNNRKSGSHMNRTFGNRKKRGNPVKPGVTFSKANNPTKDHLDDAVAQQNANQNASSSSSVNINQRHQASTVSKRRQKINEYQKNKSPKKLAYQQQQQELLQQKQQQQIRKIDDTYSILETATSTFNHPRLLDSLNNISNSFQHDNDDSFLTNSFCKEDKFTIPRKASHSKNKNSNSDDVVTIYSSDDENETSKTNATNKVHLKQHQQQQQQQAQSPKQAQAQHNNDETKITNHNSHQSSSSPIDQILTQSISSKEQEKQELKLKHHEYSSSTRYGINSSSIFSSSDDDDCNIVNNNYHGDDDDDNDAMSFGTQPEDDEVQEVQQHLHTETFDKSFSEEMSLQSPKRKNHQSKRLINKNLFGNSDEEDNDDDGVDVLDALEKINNEPYQQKKIKQEEVDHRYHGIRWKENSDSTIPHQSKTPLHELGSPSPSPSPSPTSQRSPFKMMLDKAKKVIKGVSAYGVYGRKKLQQKEKSSSSLLSLKKVNNGKCIVIIFC